MLLLMACHRAGDRAPKKTGRPVRFELAEQPRQAINDYLVASGRKADDCLFNGRRSGRNMTTRQYVR